MLEEDILEKGKKRSYKILSIFVFMSLVLVSRLLFIQIVKHSFYVDRSYDQRLRIITLSPDRGDIFDRNGNLLATSINSYSVFAVPASVKDKDKVAGILSKTLGENKYGIFLKLSSNKPFVWIKRKIEEPVVKALMDKKIAGIGFLPEKKRVYPNKKLASQVLGFVGMDNQGLSGIELSYDRFLRGQEGKLISERDPRGREILTSTLRELKASTNGMNITLTIDEPIQYKAEQEIKRAVVSNNAKNGCVIVMDVKSGEILALATYPDFDPNEYQKFKENVWYNRVVTDVYEPGSTFKLITVASAIEENKIKKDSKVFCPDQVELGGKTIKNSHKLKFKTKYLLIEEILGESVNVGAVEIAKMMGKNKFYDHIRDFGFGSFTGIDLPGESRGMLKGVKDWNQPDIGMVSFGQSIAITPIQLISAIAAIANKGNRLKPILVKKIESVDQNYLKVNMPEHARQVISEKTGKDVLLLSEAVVEKGTGRPAKIAGFRIGGKTGTAQKAKSGGGGYIPGSYVSSFVGIAPISMPRIVVLAIIDEPQPHYWGERVAAPVFREVADFSIRRLNIAPDKKSGSMI